MAYTGRRVAVGDTQDDLPVLGYGVEGRSDASRSRIAVIHGGRVSIEPADELTPEQLVMKSRIIYDAIITSAAQQFGVVSNGRHTRSIYRRHSQNNKLLSKEITDPMYAEVDTVLKHWGHEGKVGDRYNTPRIAGILDAPDYSKLAALGMVTAEPSE